MDYNPPKLWVPGEPFLPSDFNLHVKENFNYLSQRAGDVKEYAAGALADIALSALSSPYILDAADNYLLEIAPILDVNLWFTGTWYFTHGTTAQDRALDIYWVEKGIYLSTFDTTPATRGIASFSDSNINTLRSANISWMQMGVEPGEWSFAPVLIWGSGSATTLDRTNGNSFFSVLAF